MEQTQTFLEAVKKGNTEAALQLLAHEANLINARDDNGTSAVLLAMYYSHPELAQVLAGKSAGLDIFEAATLGQLERVKAVLADDSMLMNAYAQDGFYPLGLACFFGQTAVAEYLITHGADVNQPARNPQLVRPIHAASANGNLSLVRLLVEHGVDVNAKQSNDFMPLHNAAQIGNLEMAKLFLEKGAEVNAASKDGKTPLYFAVEGKHEAVAALLRERGGK